MFFSELFNSFSGNKTEITAQETSGGVAGKQGFVPSNLTINQLMDYLNGSGDVTALDYYGINAGGTLLSYPTFARCIEFIAGSLARLICDPDSLMVLDDKGNHSTSNRAKRAINLLTKSPDNVIPANTFIEDLVSDYLINGNGLVGIDSYENGAANRLLRFESEGAYTTYTAEGLVYYMKDSYNPAGALRGVPADKIAHIRWPMLGMARGSNRSMFAKPPIQLMRPSVNVGLYADNYVRDWFRDGGNQASIAIIFEDDVDSPEVQKEFKDNLAKRRSRTPLILGNNAKVQSLDSDAQNKDLAELRRFQIMEVARFFSIPPAVLGEGDIDEAANLGQIAWRFGLQNHTARVLSALSFRLLNNNERFDVDPLTFTRGDPEAIAKLATVARTGPNGTGDMTREEFRRMLNLAASPKIGTLGPEREFPENAENKDDADSEAGSVPDENRVTPLRRAGTRSRKSNG